MTALWWLIVTLPLLKGYKQKNYVETKAVTVGQTFGKIFGTLKKMAVSDRKVFFFLIGFFLYIDGVGTIIDNCINIGTDLNLNTVGQVIFLLATQVVAFGGSLFFAKLSRKKDTVSLILICIAGYFCICLYALTLRTLVHFAILASALDASRDRFSRCHGRIIRRSFRLRTPGNISASTIFLPKVHRSSVLRLLQL